MSSMFEGVFCAASPEELRERCGEMEKVFRLEYRRVDEEVSAVNHADVKAVYWFFEEFEELAQKLSADFRKSLLVRYNDQVGTRISYYYEDGKLVNWFDMDDELFTAKWLDGEDIEDENIYTNEEADEMAAEGYEFETYHGPIEMGLELFGHGDPQKVMDHVRGGENKYQVLRGDVPSVQVKSRNPETLH